MSTNRPIRNYFSFLSRFYKRSQLYILYSDDSLDKCQTKSFGKYETSASGNLQVLSHQPTVYIAMGTGCLGFDFRAGQITHSLTNGSPPLRCFFGAVLSRRYAAEMDPASRYTLWCNTASIMKELILFTSGSERR